VTTAYGLVRRPHFARVHFTSAESESVGRRRREEKRGRRLKTKVEDRVSIERGNLSSSEVRILLRRSLPRPQPEVEEEEEDTPFTTDFLPTDRTAAAKKEVRERESDLSLFATFSRPVAVAQHLCGSVF
jgi:hypothetical protein